MPKGKTQPKFPNRLREIRARRGLTLEEVAERLGTSVPTVQRREVGNIKLKVEELEAYAQALGTEPEQILPGSKMIPVVGKVGAGALVYPIDDHAKGGGLDEVSCPPNLDPAKTVAVIVEGDSMFPLQSGWILFYSRARDLPPAELVGQLCIVKVANDGPMLVKQLRRGFDRGRYTLVSSNAPPMENIEVEWAARVLSMLPPD